MKGEGKERESVLTALFPDEKRKGEKAKGGRKSP